MSENVELHAWSAVSFLRGASVAAATLGGRGDVGAHIDGFDDEFEN